jgi:prepilin-type N-terminal cleavage/methylation domain-containing protein
MKVFNRQRSPARGFSIIELLAAVVIMAIVAMGIGTLFPRAMAVSTQNRLLSRAYNVAHGKIEEFYRMPANAAAIAAGTHGPEMIDGLNCSWNIQINTPITRMRRVEVGVTWATSSVLDSVGVVTYIMK